ncbi:MarR family transcriptional regulator [Secundilactobacillus kimchicus]|uniref:MarR family winged helix-turn-helix transcriptional regulator n=1 Tax=Secundilactobacillus kimchicus TaxID=528209 RepID=UPI001C016500|nr:MarR family transcriptional regulator [Secundilactobacillus kimchicus]MBT9672518.1 MarR family transcriptional regulator [Secundilactobacillus kimchicus]
MEQDQITTIRQFNREYVQLLGVLDRRVFDTELPFPEARILLMIFEQQSIRPIDVAAALSVDKGYVSRLIRQLEAKQFVKKVPSAQDGRSKLLQLTSAGVALAQQIDADSNAQITRLFDPLTVEDKKAALQAIKTLQQLLLK